MNEADKRRHEIIGRQAVRIDALEEYYKTMSQEVERLMSLFAKIEAMEGAEGIDDHKFAKIVLTEIIPAASKET